MFRRDQKVVLNREVEVVVVFDLETITVAVDLVLEKDDSDREEVVLAHLKVDLDQEEAVLVHVEAVQDPSEVVVVH